MKGFATHFNKPAIKFQSLDNAKEIVVNSLVLFTVNSTEFENDEEEKEYVPAGSNQEDEYLSPVVYVLDLQLIINYMNGVQGSERVFKHIYKKETLQ